MTSNRDASRRSPAGGRAARAVLEDLASSLSFDQVASRQQAARAQDLAAEAGDRVTEAEALLAGGRWVGSLIDPLSAWNSLQLAHRMFRANDLPARAAACQVAMAQARYELGHERQSDVMALAALQEPALSAADRVRACIVRFLALGRMGQIEAAYDILSDHAIPLAEACGDSRLQAFALCLKAWLLARLMHSADNPSLPLPAFADQPRLHREGATLARVLSLLDQAAAALPAGTRWAEIEIARHYALGLQRRPRAAAAAAEALVQEATQTADRDPPLAAWGRLCAAMVLHDAGDWAGALSSLAVALEIAEAARLPGATRDILFYQALCHEAAGDVSAALAAYKWHYALAVQAPQADNATVSGSLDHWVQVLPAGTESEAPHRLRALEPACVRRAIRFMDVHLTDPIDIADVVAASGMSRRTLDAAFKAARSMTVSAWLKRKKLEFAANLVLHTDNSIREIAASIGYRSTPVFSTEFRNLLGVLPSEWRSLRTPRTDSGGAPADQGVS